MEREILGVKIKIKIKIFIEPESAG